MIETNTEVCRECGEPFIDRGRNTYETSVGYFSPADHDHNDNCVVRVYLCVRGHITKISIRRTCPSCNWKGKEKCFCHEGLKVDAWPEIKYDQT